MHVASSWKDCRFLKRVKATTPNSHPICLHHFMTIEEPEETENGLKWILVHQFKSLQYYNTVTVRRRQEESKHQQKTLMKNNIKM